MDPLRLGHTYLLWKKHNELTGPHDSSGDSRGSFPDLFIQAGEIIKNYDFNDKNCMISAVLIIYVGSIPKSLVFCRIYLRLLR